MAYRSILYRVVGRVAHIELNRPERLNAIDEHMPSELENAVNTANLDDNVRVCDSLLVLIILTVSLM